MYVARVEVMLKPGVTDPQGKAVLGAVHALGYDGVSEVGIGKMIELHIAADDEKAAKQMAREMGQRLLANPVLEDYRVVSVVPGRDS